MSHDTRMTEDIRDRSARGQRDLSTGFEPKSRFELSLPQIMAGALAAASAAVAASWLGVAGTVLGAVVASVVVSVSTALYKHPIERSSQVLRATLPVLPVLPERYRAMDSSTSGATETLLLSATDELDYLPAASPGVAPVGAPVETPTSVSEKRRVHWGAVAASSALTLVAGFGILTGFEVLLGQSASSLTGSDSQNGPTLSRIVEPAPDTATPSEPDPSTPGNTDNTEPADPAPTEPEPTEPTPTEPTEPTPTEPAPTEPTTDPTAPAPTDEGAPPDTSTDAPVAPVGEQITSTVDVGGSRTRTA